MPSKPETRLRKKIVEALREKYPQGWFKKIWGSPFQDAGIPDIIGCVNGVFIGIEVKEEGEEATPIQKREIRLLLQSGGEAGVATSPQEALDIVKNSLIRHNEI